MFKKIEVMLNKIKWMSLLSDFILILGVILVTIGTFKIYVPAGYIVLGICFIAFAFFMAQKGVKG